MKGDNDHPDPTRGPDSNIEPKLRALKDAEAAARAAVSSARRDSCRHDLELFCRTYLPSHFRLPSSPMHRTIIRHLSATRLGLRLAIAAPRGHAKSTLLSLGYLLWRLCYEEEKFIWLISDTADQAADLLTIVKRELDGNHRLIEDFPMACEVPGIQPGPERWQRRDIIARNGVRVLAQGAEQRTRGKRHGEHRPTLIILDDIEDEELANAPEQRDKRSAWLNGTLLKAGSSVTNVIAVGTILHHDSVLARLLDRRRSPNWTQLCYKAVVSYADRKDLWQTWDAVYNHRDDYEGRSGPEAAHAFYKAQEEAMLEGAEVLWPELESYEALMIMRLTEGQRAFDAEKQNDPTDPEGSLFVESELHYWDDDYPTAEDLIRAIGSRGTICGACDPSLGRSGRRADDTAIVMLLRDRHTNVHYVIDADIRRRKPDDIIDTILHYMRLRRCTNFGVEKVQFQEFLRTEIERRSMNQSRPVRIKAIDQTTDKTGRIQSLQPMIAAGKLRFSRRHVTLIEQLLRFPYAAHDDGPDALEMAVRMAARPVVWFPKGELV